MLFSVALLLVFLHSAWDVEPSVGLDVVEVSVSSPKVELTVPVLIEPEVKVLGDIFSVEELTVMVDVDPEVGFKIMGIEYFIMNLFRTSFPSEVMCCTSLE